MSVRYALLWFYPSTIHFHYAYFVFMYNLHTNVLCSENGFILIVLKKFFAFLYKRKQAECSLPLVSFILLLAQSWFFYAKKRPLWKLAA